MSHKRMLEVDRASVRRKLEKSDREVQEYIDIIKNWFHQQPHLPEIPSDELIEFFLVFNKFSIENTKSKLDMYYTVRSLLPEIFRDTQPELPHMKETAKVVLHCPLPKLTPELYRVWITKIMGDSEAFNPYLFFAHQLNMIEITLNTDLNMGYIVIMDFQEIKMGHIMKLTPIIIRKALLILENVFSNRMKGLHFINSPPFVDKLVLILKSLLKQKLIERVHVHADSASLNKYISKEILPKDYGGDEISVRELSDIWNRKMEECKDRFDKLNSLMVDEGLRPTPLKNHDFLGYYGNFKKLDID